MKAHLFAGTHETPTCSGYPVMDSFKGTFVSFDAALENFREIARGTSNGSIWGEILWEDNNELRGCWLSGEGDTWQILPKPTKANWLSGV